MSKLINLVGQKFGRLTVIERDTKYEKSVRGNSVYWRCKCDCGNYKTVSSIHLKDGHTKSCGCYNKELLSKRSKKYNKYDLKSKYAIGYTNKGEEFYFDLEDYDKIKCYCWRLDKNQYVVTTVNNKKILLHRFLLDNPRDLVIDHINHNTNDNRKSNLRIVTVADNLCNMKLRRNNTSGHKGVYKNGKYWVADLRRNKTTYRKQFKILEQAIEYRMKLEEKYQKEFRYKEENINE